MEPITIGVAAAALLASKFVESLANGAGESAWESVKRIRRAVATKFRGDPVMEQALGEIESAEPTPATTVTIARRIADAAAADIDFGRQLAEFITTARRDKVVDSFVAQAFDSAKQINIRGDNSGPITM